MRLIDADKLDFTAVADSLATIAITGLTDDCVIEYLKEYIDAQPTAYDVEKVVAELEEAYEDHGDTTEHYKEYVDRIVRNGGKE